MLLKVELSVHFSFKHNASVSALKHFSMRKYVLTDFRFQIF